MNEQSRGRGFIFLLVGAGCILFMFSGGIRSNFGILVQALADRAKVSYADVSFAVAAGLLLTTLANSVVTLVITIGLLFATGTGALCFGIIMGTISPVLGERRASAASGILNASSRIGGSLLSPLMQALQASLGVGKLLVILSVPVCAGYTLWRTGFDCCDIYAVFA